MKLLTIYPIQSCNLDCYYCPMKQWTYPVDDPANKLNNKIIFKWIDKYLNPEEWLIEISGGEPGVYSEIDSLVKGLSARGYYGLIKTNGTLPIPKTDTFLRIAAWHESRDLYHPPEYVDKMLIIRNPNDCWEDKLEYCQTNNIPYKDLQFIPHNLSEDEICELNLPEADPPRNNIYIDEWCVVYSGGRIARCYSESNCEEVSVLRMSPPETHRIKTGCVNCIQVGGFEVFIPDEWVDMIRKNDYKYFLARTQPEFLVKNNNIII